MLRPVAAALLGAALSITAPAAGAQTVIKIGSPSVNDTIHHWMQSYKAAVEKAAPGRLTVEIYPASQLGPVPRMIEGAQLGSIEMVIVPADFLGGVDRRLTVVGAPGVFKDQMQGFKTMHDPEFVQPYASAAAAKGLQLLGSNCDSYSTFAFRTPVATLNDFAGKKVRILGSGFETEMLRRMKASPVVMTLGEVPTALQQGVLDGSKSGLVVFPAQKYQSVARYLVGTQESLLCTVKFASKAWFDKLPADLQKVLQEQAARVDVEEQSFAIEFTRSAMRQWQDGGGVVTEWSGEDRAEFAKRLQSVAEDVAAKDGSIRDIYSVMKRVARKFE